MNIDPGREMIDEGKRSRRTLERLRSVGKSVQAGQQQAAQSPSQKPVDQSKRMMSNGSHGSKEQVREAVRSMPSLPAWLCRLGCYGLALLFVGVAALLRWALSDVLSPTPFLIFYLAWVGAAAFGGLGPGLLATLASWMCVELLFDFTPGQVSFADPASIVRLLVLLAGGLAVSVVAERMRRGRIHERRQRRELAELVQLTDLGPFLILDEQNRIVRWSEGCARLYGFTAEQAIGRVSHELLRTRFPQPLEAIQATLHKTGRWEGELTQRCPDGSVVHVASLWVLRDDTANPAVLEVNNDITDSKRAKEQLARSERQHRLLFETTPQGVVYQDVDGKIISMNPAAERILGKTPAEFLGRTSVDEEYHTLREDGSPFPGREHPAMVSLRTGQEMRDVVMGVYNPREKAYRWINIASVPLFRPGEDKPYQVYTHFADITARKQAEETLRESEEKYRYIVETATEGIVMVDANARVVFANDRWSEIFGYSLEEARRVTLFDLVFPEDRAQMAERWESRKRGAKESYEFRFRRKDGNPVWILGGVAPRFDPEGRFLGTLVMVTDITKRKQAEEALRELTRTLESKVAERTAELKYRARQLQKLTLDLSQAEDRERKRLAEILHDDLQQVLAAAKFQLSLLKGRVKNDPQSQEIAGQVKALLADAINKSRSLSHELSAPALAQGDLSEAFEWLTQQMQTKHGLTVHLDVRDRIELPSEPLWALLYRAAQELLFNVVKHAGVREATLRVRHRHGRICLFVSDKGQGFDPKNSGKTSGFGLLSIRERIDLLGGRMKVRSVAGKGSTFVITVPDSDARKPALPNEVPSAEGGVSATEE